MAAGGTTAAAEAAGRGTAGRARKRRVPMTAAEARAMAAAAALLAEARELLGQVDGFSREDLLHLPALGHVSTITRYRYVCDAVNRLLADGRLVAAGRTELCLPGREDRQRPAAELAAEFHGTVRRVAAQRMDLPVPGIATVAEVVASWGSDQHLTTNTKRVIVRAAFRALVREGWAEPCDAPGAIRRADGGAGGPAR